MVAIQRQATQAFEEFDLPRRWQWRQTAPLAQVAPEAMMSGAGTDEPLMWKLKPQLDFDGFTPITKDNAEQYRIAAKGAHLNSHTRGPDSAPALFYRQVTGKDWEDADAHSYSIMRKRFHRLLPVHSERLAEQERERQQQGGNEHGTSSTVVPQDQHIIAL